VLGDVVCGGFANSIREGYAKEIYVVARGELMTLYASNNICKGIMKFAEKTMRVSEASSAVPAMWTMRRGFCRSSQKIGSQLIQFVPRDNIVQIAEINRKTVIDFDPACKKAEVYRSLAKNIIDNRNFVIPNPWQCRSLRT
jgi:nitrogenase iron protein NifH